MSGKSEAAHTGKKVVKLARTPLKSDSRQHSEPQSIPPSSEAREIICRERIGLVPDREGLLGQYYDNLEFTVVELEKAREFLKLYKHLTD